MLRSFIGPLFRRLAQPGLFMNPFRRKQHVRHRRRFAGCRPAGFAHEALETRSMLAASVTTDLQDYLPGQTAIISAFNDTTTGQNFSVGEMVRFQVTRTDGVPDYPGGNLPWFVVDGQGGFAPYQATTDIDSDGIGDWIRPDTDGTADGSIGTSWFVEQQYLRSYLLVTATGVGSGAAATHAFTDGAASSGDGVLTLSAVAGSLTPATGATGQRYTFAFVSDPGKDYGSGSAATLRIPAGWTVPQNTSSTTAGFASVATVGTATATIASITQSGSDYLITVNFTTNGNNDGFNLSYGGANGTVTAPATAGTYAFTMQTRSGSGGTFTGIATQQSVTVSQTAAANGDGTVSLVAVAGSTSPQASSTGNRYQFQYRIPSGEQFGANSTATILIPSGWTVPQTGSSSTGGFTTIAAAGNGTASITSITTSGSNRLITINFSGTNGDGFNLDYGGSGTGAVTAPAAISTYTFTTRTAIPSGTLTNIASQPSITTLGNAPVLSGGGTLTAVNEDTASPSGAALNSLGITANDTADSGSIGGYAIVSNAANSSTQGKWQYSTNSGTNWYDIGTVSDGSTALALSAATLVRFLPAANFNGAPTSLTIRAIDGSYSGGFSTAAGTQSRVTVDTTTNGGSTSISSATASITTSITALNDAPVAGGSASLTAVNEDTASPSGATVSTLFGGNFSDSTDTVTSGSSANTFIGMVVTANAATAGQGKWQWLSGSTWNDISTSLTNASGRFYSAATSVRFLPAANFNGTPGALTVQLVDSSITAPTNGGSVDVSTNGGTTAYSSATVALSTSVISVNDAPAGTNKTATINQDTSYTFTGSDFGFTDTSDNPANTLAAVKVSTLPAVGSLRYNGTAITQTQVDNGYEVSKADIDSGKLVFVPVAGAFATPYASFTFQVRDGGGTSNGGADLDATPNTVTFNVSKVDAVAPAFTSGTTASIKTNTNVLYTAVATDAVNFTNGVVTYGLQGTPQLGGVNASLLINASTGVVTTAGGLAQVGTYTFTVTASDASGNTSTRAVTVTATSLSSGAIDLSSPSSDWNVVLAGSTYDPADDTQASAAKGLDLVGDAANPMFYSRYNADTGEIAFRIREETVNAKGVFYLIGLINPNSGVTNADTKILGFIGLYIDSSSSIDANGVPSKYTVAFYDAGSNSNTSPSTSSFVTRNATVPTGSSAHVMAVGGGSNLDPTDTSGPDGFVSFKFSAAQFETWAKSRLTPGTNAYAVTDPLAIVVMTATQNNSINGDFGGLSGSSGQSYKDLGIATPAVLANNPPQSADTAVTAAEDTTYTFAASAFPFADADAGDSLQRVRIDSLPAKGTLRLNGSAVTAGTVVTVAQLSSSLLTYEPPANQSGVAFATFRFSVNDGKSWAATPQTATINVTPANDPPVINLLNGDVAYWTDSNVPVPFDSTPSAVVSDSDSLDFDGGVLTIAVTGGTSSDNRISIVQGGSVAVNGTDVLYNGVAIGVIGGSGQTLTVTLNANATQAAVSALISAARFTYFGSEAAPAIRTITVSVTDGDGGTSNTATVQMVGPPIYVVEGNEDSAISANQAPKNVEGTSTLSQIAAASGTHLKLLVVNGTLSYTRASSSRTAAVNDVLTIAELATLSFTPAANAYGDGLASFRFSYCDASGNATGVLQQPTVVINVLPVNDPPVAADDGVSGAVLAGSITELVGTAGSTEARTAFGTVVFSDVDFADSLTVSLTGINGYAWSGGTLSDAQKSALNAAISLSLGAATASTTSIAQFARADWSFSVADSALDFLAKNETLTVTRTVEVSDGTATASTTITVTITGTNDVPRITTTDAAQLGGTISEVSGSSNFGGATLSGTIAYADVDLKDTHVATVAVPAIIWNDGTGVKTAAELETAIGTSAFTLILNAASAPGTFALGTPSTSGGTGSVGWTFTPAAAFKFLRAGQSLELAYTVHIDDQNGGVATQDVVVTITGVSDAPSGADATLSAHQNEPLLLTDSNFGFTDDDSDNRVSVIVTTLPTAGTLQFKNGSDVWVSVTASQEVSFDDIMAGRLRFVPVTNAAVASPYDSFTFQVRDDGSTNPLQNTDQIPNTITFNLLDYRGPNQTVPLEQEIDEDSELVFSGSKKISIAFIGEDGETNDVETIRTTLAVTAGTLTLGSTPDGLSITGNGTTSIVLEGRRSQVNAAIDGLRFAPGANLNSIVQNGKHTFTVLTVTTVNVPAEGGFLYATDTDTVDIGVRPVNDAPVATGSATLASVDEDTTNPPGASVATLFGGNFNDSADQVVGGSSANTLAGIAITGHTGDSAKGVWQYSVNGTSWTTVPNVTGSATGFTLKAGDMLRFLPSVHYFGAVPSITVRLIDSSVTVTTAAAIDASVNGGTTAISAATVVLSTSIISVNDLPVPTFGTDQTATEDGAVVSGQLTSTDVDNVAPPTYSLVGDPIGGLVINPNGSFSFDPSDSAYQSLAVDETREITVTYKVTDDQGGFATRSFKITVTGVDDLQTGISLTESSIPENSAAGTAVGGLRTADADVSDTFTYTLVSGTGDTDNDKFEIVSGVLQAKQSFDFENPVGASGNTYRIRVRSMADLAGRNPATIDSALTVTVLNVLEKLTVALVTDSRRSDVVAVDKITNVGAVQLGGTGGETIGIESPVTSGTADNRIEYSIDNGDTWSSSFRPVQGLNSVQARQVDPAGVLAPSPASDAFTFTFDTIARMLVVSLADDTGSSSSDKVTSVGTLTVSPIESGAVVEYSIDGGANWATTFTPKAGLNSLRVRQVDIAGNESDAATFVFTFDDAAVKPTVQLTSDTGASVTDGKTRVGLVKVSGIETGASFAYSVNGGTTWTSSFTPVAGENKVLVRQADVAGNSAVSDELSFWLDTVALAPIVSLASDTGKSSTDKITSDGRLEISNAEAGAVVEYSTNGGATWGTSFTPVAGLNTVRVRQTDQAGNVSPTMTFSFTFDNIVAAPRVVLTRDTGINGDRITSDGRLTVTGTETAALVEYSADGLTGWSGSFPAVEGDNTVYVRQTDVAGNVSGNGMLTFKLDTTAAAAPTVSLLSDTGTSAVDGVTKTGTLSVGGVETGAKVEYSTNGGTTWGTSFTPAQGANTVKVRQTDVAGNVSGLGTLTFTLDTSVAAPVVVLTSDTGKSLTDKITSIGALAVTNTESGALVEFSPNGTTWSTSYTPVVGLNTVRVRQTDFAGNVSTVTTFTFTFDTSAVAPTARLTSDTGSSTTDKITRLGGLTLTGVETGALVEYSADGSTGWSSSFTPAEGANTVYLRQTDVAGNVSGNGVLTFTLDTTAAAAPTVSLLSDTGASATDQITRIGTLSLAGTEAGAKIEYQLNAGTTWTTTFTPVSGKNEVRVRQTDVAGNVSGLGTLTFTLDTTAAKVNLLTLPTSGTYAIGSKITVKVKFSEAVFIGGTGASPYLILKLSSAANAATRNAVYESGSGTDEFTFSYVVANGDSSTGIVFPTSITLPTNTTLQDASGNTSGVSGTLPSPLPSVKI